MALRRPLVRVASALLALGVSAPPATAVAAGARKTQRQRAAPATGLLWPLEFDDGLSAAFGELRGDRLHTGTDLRTRGETGFPVRAVADGEVVRLKEEWRGYGLALYLALPGGRIAVYGHLERVAPDLERRLAASRHSRGGRWAGDVELEPGRRARRGEVIAWSGESGAGLPHLHFELREGMDRPIDPFAAGLAPPRDETPPVAERLVIEPAGEGARVAGRAEPLTVTLRPGPDGYHAEAPIAVRGPVRLLLEAYDRAGAESRAGLGGLAVTLDGETAYELRFDAIPFGLNSSSGAVLDLARSHLSPTFYTYRLTGLEGAELPFARGARGAIALPPGRHRLEARLGDAVTTLGMRTRVVAEFVAEPEPGLRPEPEPESRPEPEPEHGSRVASVATGETTTMSLGAFRMEVSAKAAWATVRVRAQEVAATLPEGLVAMAPAVALAPDGHPFRSPITLRFEAPGGVKAGVYRLDAVTGEWGIEDLGVTARVRRLGTYALLEDRAAPVLGELRRRGDGLLLEVHDLGSGIPERGVEIVHDGERIEELYDPDRGWVTAKLPAAPREREVWIRATDRAGNTSERRERLP